MELVISLAALLAAYLRAKVVIDRTAGGVLGLLGLKLMVSGSEAV